ncbi:MAG: hypothetical protein KAJ10_09470, partial [Thermodesulfovibrionia bacterium]|nr:hypothetical protein [Thermodesulfovibrionia bacterium]
MYNHAKTHPPIKASINPHRVPIRIPTILALYPTYITDRTLTNGYAHALTRAISPISNTPPPQRIPNAKP